MGAPQKAAQRGRAVRSGSSTGPEAAAPHPLAAQRHRMGGPGEDRYLTRVGPQYAPGCWWGVLFPPPAASRRVRGLGRSPKGWIVDCYEDVVGKSSEGKA